MIRKIISSIEEQAKTNKHDIGGGFYETKILNKKIVLRLNCSKCDFFAILDPETGRFLRSNKGLCSSAG